MRVPGCASSEMRGCGLAEEISTTEQTEHTEFFALCMLNIGVVAKRKRSSGLN